MALRKHSLDTRPLSLKRAILLLFIGISSSVFAQDEARLQEMLTSVFNVNNFSITNFELVGDDGIAADVTLFNHPGLAISATGISNGKLNSVEASFANPVTISPTIIAEKLIGSDAIETAIPAKLLNAAELSLSGFLIKMDEDTGSFDNFSASFSLGSLDMLDFNAFEMEDIGLTLSINSDKVLSGTIDSVVTFDGTAVEIGATLSSDKSEMVFNGSFETSLTVGKLISDVGGDALIAEFNGMLPAGEIMNAIPLPSFTFEIYPVDKKFHLETANVAGLQTLDVVKKDKLIFTYAYAPPEGGGFKDIDPDLSVIDDLNVVENLHVEVTNDIDNPMSKKSGGVGIQVGASLIPNDFIEDFLTSQGQKEMPSVDFYGGISSSLDFNIRADLNLNLELVEGWEFEKVNAGLNLKKSSAELSFGGSMIMPIDDQELRFSLDVITEPVQATLGGVMELESIDEDKNQTEWQEPFGIPSVSFTSIKGGIAVSGTTVVDNVQLGGEMAFGAIPAPSDTTDVRMRGTLDARIDVNPSQSQVKGEFYDLKLLNFIEALSGETVPEDLKAILNTGIDTLKVDLQPGNQVMKAEGTITLFDIVKARAKIDYGLTTGYKFGGSIDPIDLRTGSVSLFRLNAMGDPSKGAEFYIDINPTAPEIYWTLETAIFGLELFETLLIVNKVDGLKLTADIDVGVLGHGSITATANFETITDVSIIANVEPDALGNIKRKLVKAVEDEGGAVAGEIVDTVIPSFGISDITLAASQKGFVSSLSADVRFYAKIFGDTIPMRINVPLSVDFASPEKIPETILLIIGEISLELLSQFGNIAFKAVEALVVFVGESLIAIGEGLVDLGEAAYNELFGDIQFATPEAGGPVTYVPAGYRHYSVKFTEINIIKSDETSGDDVYGQITVGLNSPNATWAPHTNENIFGESEGDKYLDKDEKSEPFGGSHTKHFYAKYNEDIQLQFGGTLYENDGLGEGDDTVALVSADNVRNIRLKSFGSEAESRKKTLIFMGTDTNSEWHASVEITAHKMITTDELWVNIKDMDYKALNTNINKGGDIKAISSKAIDHIITKYKQYHFASQAEHGPMIKNAASILMLMEMAKVNASADNLTNVLGFRLDEASIPVPYQILNMTDSLDINPSHINKALISDYGQGSFVHELLSHGAKPDASNLTTALDQNVYSVAKELISEHGLLPNKTHFDAALVNSDSIASFITLPHITPDDANFESVAAANKTALFKAMLDRDVSLGTIEPAKYAIDNNNLEILALSLKHGVPVDSVIVYSVEKGNPGALLECLKAGGNAELAVLPAIRNGNVGLLEVIEQERPDTEFNNQLYLIAAVNETKKGSHVATAEFLIKKGIDPNLYRTRKKGNTLLHLVSKRSRRDRKGQIGPFSLPKTEPIDLGNGKQFTLPEIKPFYLPNIFGKRRDYGMMEMLINNGADIGVTNKKGWTSLHMAVRGARRSEDIRLVKLMVEKEISLTKESQASWDKFQNDTENISPNEMISMLTEINNKRANMDACTNKRKPVYCIAGGRKVKRYLKARGARTKKCSK